MINTISFLFLFLTASLTPAHAAGTLKPGTYISERDTGTLEIQPAAPSGAQKFGIGALGGNGHVCDVEGEIINNRAETEDHCVIQFKPGNKGIDVELTEECNGYCGARARFPSVYFDVEPYCRNIEGERKKFQDLYNAKKYAYAKKTLTELLNRCEKFMYWHAQTEVRNDLAITEFHLGNKAACLKALTPIEDYVKGEPYFTPIDEEWGNEMTRITRFNWKKCGGAVLKN